MSKITGYIGAYTGAAFDKKAKGIYAFTLNLENGRLEGIRLLAESVNPSYLCIPPSRKYLYAVNELNEFEGKPSGAVSAFALEEGSLRFLNTVSSEGASPCHIAVDAGERFAVVANYTGGTLAVLPLLAEGGLGGAVQRIVLNGKGPNAQRQEASHAHSFVFDPGNAYGFACDLGADRVMAYSFQGSASQPLREAAAPWYSGVGGAGPRHSVFHPSLNCCYVVNELDSTVDVLGYDPGEGRFERLGRYSTLPPETAAANTAGAIKISGGALYASNRGHDSLAVFRIRPDGLLEAFSSVPSGGRTPRDFALDPSGAFLIAANQDSDNLIVFRVDRAGAPLVKIGEYPAPSPVCVIF